MKTNIENLLLKIMLAFGTTFALTALPPRAFSQGGVPLWTNRHNGQVSRSSALHQAIAVDPNGNVFVTGPSWNSTDNDYETVAYSGAGVPMWTNRYNGPGNGDDYARAIAVDNHGTVLVTGQSLGSGGSYDYATVAYSGAGVPLWTNCYNGPGNDYDGANAIAVDGNGNVFVTGASVGITSGLDYTTVAYSGAGVPLWTNCYNGPGNGYDDATAIAADSNGNVFVTGTSSGSGSGYDYATVAYSRSGVPLWTNRYSGPGIDDYATAIAVDRSGNVFVTGQVYYGGIPATMSDYATVAYSGAGVPLWIKRYNGTGFGYDSANAIAVDLTGKVFVTGTSLGKGGSYDYGTVAYSSAGVPLWTNRYNGPGNGGDNAFGIAVDTSGNVFVTGLAFLTTNTNLDNVYKYATVAYSGAGKPQWTNLYSGMANGDAGAFGIAVDGNGNVFVTGYADTGSSNYEYTTIKYSSNILPIRLAIETDGNSGFFIRYRGAPDVTYCLQRAASLTGTWFGLTTNTAPASGLVEYHDTSRLPGQAFYRAVQP